MKLEISLGTLNAVWIFMRKTGKIDFIVRVPVCIVKFSIFGSSSKRVESTISKPLWWPGKGSRVMGFRSYKIYDHHEFFILYNKEPFNV